MSTGLTREQSNARREDLAWMADTGECLSGALRRLNITRAVLEKWCHLNDCFDLYRRLAAREHVDQKRIRMHDNRIYTHARRTAA